MAKLFDSIRPLIPDGGLGRAARLAARFRRPLTAVDIDGQVLRVVQTGRRHGNRVTRYVAEELEALTERDRDNPETVGLRMAQALERLKLKPKAVVMGVPRALVVLRTMHLPAPDHPRELASMVHFQAAKDLPFPVKDAVIDFKLRGETTRVEVPAAEGESGDGGRPKVEVLVAAVKKEVVDSYVRTAEAAGLQLAALGLRSYANARCVGACNLSDQGEHVALVSLRPDEVIIDVLEEQTLVFSRVVSVSQTSDENEENGAGVESETTPSRTLAGSVTIEVVRSLHSFEGMMPHKRVNKVVVSGGTGDERAVVEALQSRLSVPCYLLNPAAALGLPESSGEYAPGAMAVIGLGLGVNDPEGLPFDFLKPKQPVVRRDTRRLKMMAAAAGAMALVLLAGAFYARAMGEQRDRKARAAAQLKSERDKSKTLYRPLLRQVKAVEAWVGEEEEWLKHYAYLSRVLPSNKDIYLRSISTGNGRLRLAVQARSGDVLTAMGKRLREAGYDVRPVSFVPGPNSDGYPFQTSVELAVPEKMDFGETKEKGSSAAADGGSAEKEAGR